MWRSGAVLCAVLVVGCGGGDNPGGPAGGSGGQPGVGGSVSGNGGATSQGSGGAVGPTCRGAAGACALTSDCCSGLICQGNQCVQPPQCRGAAAACAITTDCCAGLICEGNTCSAPPTCGDGKCSPGETQDSCCTDCGCVLGSYCSVATHACIAASVSMTWTFTDSCVDGLAIQYRFFDSVNGVVWPSTLSNTFQSTADGQTVHNSIACIQGATICYGAEPNPTSGTIYWGVDLTGTAGCTACCATCGVTNPQINLTCQ
jgi:hypothetical protein